MDTPMRDLVREALHLIDYPAEIVRDWLGAPCGCPERQSKQDVLRQWARRTLDGTFSNPEERLEQILK